MTGMIARPRVTSSFVAIAAALLVPALVSASPAAAQRQAENLDRGGVSVPAQGGGNLVSWRLLSGDPAGIAFNIYRGAQLITPQPIADRTNFVDPQGAPNTAYRVRAVIDGRISGASEPVASWGAGYRSIPLAPPPAGTINGNAYSYTANDASVGDLNGDGQYEIVLKWEPTNARDNSQSGTTAPVYVDAYSLEGRRLWRINLGPNIRAGAHYTQFLVYDFDGDRSAEVLMKTADGTIDGTGRTIGDRSAVYRNAEGYILAGPEFLTAFNGRNGQARSTIPYNPPRDATTLTPTSAQLNAGWGDGYGNRVDRFLAGVAYLDGQRPSAVFTRGYYTRSVLWAVDYRGGRLTQRWLFDSDQAGSQYRGQGNHNLSVADVDDDGRDEIVFGAMAVDDDGRALWNSNLQHGDAMHLGDLIPSRPGLEKFQVHENFRTNGGIGSSMLDARTGERIWTTAAARDIGRGLALDIDPRYPGAEAWSTSTNSLYSATGSVIGNRPSQINFGIWWDGDLLREILDGTTISKWDWTASRTDTLLAPPGTVSVNGTKANPSLSADIIGDWREELILPTSDSRELRIYATPYPTAVKLRTLMSDPVYRLGVAWQNVAYNQPPHTGFFLGEGADLTGR